MAWPRVKPAEGAASCAGSAAGMAGIAMPAKLVAFNEFMKQLPHFAFRCRQSLLPQSGGPVYPAQRFAVALLRRTKVSLPLETLEQRIQAARTDPVAVPRQFLDHSKAEDRTLHRVVEHVQPDQAGIKIAVCNRVVVFGFRFRHTITNQENTTRFAAEWEAPSKISCSLQETQPHPNQDIQNPQGQNRKQAKTE